MRPADIGALVAASSPAVSPPGDLVAYVVGRIDLEANRYRSQVWLAPADGSRPAEPVSAGIEVDGGPCWSPDGRRLAFTRTCSDGATARHTLHVLPLTGGGETLTLAALPELIESVQWSPDGRWLAFTTRVRDEHYTDDDPKRQPPRRITRFFNRLDNVGWTADRPTHVHVVPVDGSAPPRDLTPGEWNHSQAAWLPDSSALVCTGARHDTWDLDFAQDLFLVPVDGGEPDALTEQTGIYEHPAPSPDGRRVAFLGHDDPLVMPQNTRVGVLDLADRTRRWVSTGLDRTFAPFPDTRRPVWEDDSHVVAAAEDRGRVHLYRVATDGAGEPELIVGGDRVLSAWDVAGGTVAFTASTTDRPAEAFALAGGTERRLSTVTDTFVATVAIGAVERFTAPSTGGVEVDAWIVTPPDFDPARRYPALLDIHGGPFSQYGDRFFDEFQLLASAGFVVLGGNPRGSSGRETPWGRAIAGPKDPVDPGSGWGSVDVDDVLAVVDEALRRHPFIDPDRLGVLGGSYGGYLTSWIVGHSSRFRAACSERAVNNLLTMEWTSDIAGWFRAELGVGYLDDPEEYLARSPVTYVRDITTPLLIVHSEDDLRCPVSQAEELFGAMRRLGKEVEFVRFPAEGHELSRTGSPVHRVQRAELLVEFFTRHLQP